MTYETIQTALTTLINVVAIAGFGGIIAHAMWKQHKTWLQTYCPPIDIDNFNSKSKYLQVEIKKKAIAPIAQDSQQAEDIWEAPITSSPARYWVRPIEPQQPTLYLLPPAKEEVKPATKKSRKTPATSKRKKAA